MPSEFQPHSTLSKLYPEVAAGGFSRHDGFIDFYGRINALLDEKSVVLDFGAGRGAWADTSLAPFHQRLRDLQKVAHKVVGIDVDPVVMENPGLDEAHVLEIGDPLPFDDATFDLVFADHVLEHVTADDAPGVASELFRVLKPGGWFAARTPNKWGAIGVGARMVPNRLHSKVLETLQPGRQVRDIFPTQYAMNTRKDLRRLFPTAQWDLAVYGHASEPQYVGHNVAAWRAASFVDQLTPPRMLPTLMIFSHKKG